MCAFSFFVKVRFAMSSIHCSVLRVEAEALALLLLELAAARRRCR